MRLMRLSTTPARFASQVAFARVATALAVMSVGALAIGALAIRRLSVQSLRLTDGSIGRLQVEELEIGRLRFREWLDEGGRAQKEPSRRGWKLGSAGATALRSRRGHGAAP